MAAPPRVLLVDIETAPIIMASWVLWEASAVWVERDTYIMCVAYKWQHEKTIRVLALPDYAGYERNRHCDKKLCADLWKLLDQADVVVAHNGNAFDIKKINSRLAVHGHHSPSSYKKVDTLQIARSVFKFDSNKLDNLGRYLGEGRKIPNTGAALWRGCCDGDAKSWQVMKRYNKQDVALLQRCYDRLKGWAPNHPNLNIISGRDACQTCQSTNVKKRGPLPVKGGFKQRFQCSDCGSWSTGPVIKRKVASDRR
jgi:hypothetical protein